MGDSISCSTQCAPSCISRQHPPGADLHEDQPQRRAPNRTYPVADPVDVHLNWQTIAVRHAWKKAALVGDTGEGPRSARSGDDMSVAGPTKRPANAEPYGPGAKATTSDPPQAGVSSDQMDVVKI
eukprot:TRINITY_DN22911_c0_g1_i1.p1 TRINITY_DN22911_c0_g1~~TRINITY_DN22911_c0_g1_i1.p1  ORF type:complete len:125 (+),score=12.82 TRINITY_DN22911_c0_g1_i1:89-463(+)